MDEAVRLPRPLRIRRKMHSGRVRVADERKGFLGSLGPDESAVGFQAGLILDKEHEHAHGVRVDGDR